MVRHKLMKVSGVHRNKILLLFSPAMSAILRDKINELLRENGNLQREVSRLRASETSRQPQSVTERTEASQEASQAGYDVMCLHFS